MDLLNKAFQQIKEVYLQLTPGSRAIAALLAGVLVVSLGYLFIQSLPSQNTVFLFNNQAFDAATLQRMEAAFGDASLNTYEMVGGRIRVPQSQRNQYMAALAEANALPSGFGDILAKTLASDSPWMTREQRDYLLKKATIAELQQVFSSMRGIERASVWYDMETRPGFLKEKIYTARVNVWPDGNLPLERRLVTAISQTMVGTVAGLRPENVVVQDGNTGLTYRADDDGVIGPGGKSYRAMVENTETHWKKKIEDSLAYIPGVIVEVGAELNDYTARSDTEIIHTKPTTYGVQEENFSRTREGADRAGRPGYEAQDNQPRERVTGNQVVRGEREQETLDKSNIASAIPGTHRQTEYAGLTPRVIRASIKVPMSYVQKIWHEENPSPDGQPQSPEANVLEAFRIRLFQAIQEDVAILLPDAEGIVDKSVLVKVNGYRGTPIAPPVLPTTTQVATTWLALHWSTVGMFGLIVASLAMMWLMLRERPIAAADTNQEVEAMQPQRAGDTPEREDEEDVARQLPGFDRKAKSLKEELSSLVSENPEAAANVLRQWIGNVSAST